MSASPCDKCARCGEDGIMVEFDGTYFARVRRITKCKKYKRKIYKLGTACCTDVRQTPQEVVEEWRQITARNE